MNAAPQALALDSADSDSMRRETEALAYAAANGDTGALGQLYDLYFDQSYRFILMRVRDVELAQDLAQDAWLAIVRNIGGYVWHEGAGWRAWLFTILRSRVTDHHRQAVFRQTSPAADPAAGLVDPYAVDPEVEGERVGLRNDVADALATLPQGYVDVLTARYWLGLSLKETAEVLSTGVGSVKIRQHRATKALGRSLNHYRDCG